MMPFGTGKEGDTTNRQRPENPVAGINHATPETGMPPFGPLLGMSKENPTEIDEKVSDPA